MRVETHGYQTLCGLSRLAEPVVPRESGTLGASAQLVPEPSGKEHSMSMSISRLSVGNPETEQALRAILEELGVPEGEVWTASITASSAAAAWEVVLDGAGRTKSDHVDWEIVQHEGLARFRRLFLGKDEQTLDYFKRSIRKLLWECVQFKDNPIRNHSQKLGEAFEEAVWNLLRNEDMQPVQVRFGVWREGPDGMKFVCKVEYASDRR